MDSHVLLISQIFIIYSTNAYLLLSSQSEHSHLPAGAAVRPTHSKWNHSIGQATLSHAIISPYFPSWHQQYTSCLSLDVAALFDFALEVRIPLEHLLFAWAFLTPSARRYQKSTRSNTRLKNKLTRWAHYRNIFQWKNEYSYLKQQIKNAHWLGLHSCNGNENKCQKTEGQRSK